MKKKLSVILLLENGKNLLFSIQNIKDIDKIEAGALVKEFHFEKIFAKEDVKVKNIKKAEIISTVHDEINIA